MYPKSWDIILPLIFSFTYKNRINSKILNKKEMHIRKIQKFAVPNYNK